MSRIAAVPCHRRQLERYCPHQIQTADNADQPAVAQHRHAANAALFDDVDHVLQTGILRHRRDVTGHQVAHPGVYER